MERKNVIFWVGVKSTNPDIIEKHNYGDYSWMEYSKKTWEYWAKQNDCYFVHYETTFHEDLSRYKVNWQRWFDVFDYIDSKGITDYDQILLTDASIMVKWDAPNFFDVTDHKFCALRGNENLKWSYESTMGYKDMFPNTKFRVNDYIASGFCIFNKLHKPMLNVLKAFYYKNHDEILEREDKLVKRGRDQPILNYILRQEDIEIKHLPIVYGVNHLYRRQVMNHNWQLNEDTTPFFVKYFYTWIFSGWPDRGKTRKDLMSQTWQLVQHHYKEYDTILDKVNHKHIHKNSTSKQFKQDLLTYFKEKEIDTIVEFGCCHGDTTRILCEIGNKVFASDIDENNITLAKEKCSDVSNIDLSIKDINTEWRYENPSVIYLDALHDIPGIQDGIDRIKNQYKSSIVIMDDYGHNMNTVKPVIDTLITNNTIEVLQWIGEDKGYIPANGKTFVDKEGLIFKFK